MRRPRIARLTKAARSGRLAHGRAEELDGLCAKLAHAGLGHAEQAADVTHRQIIAVVELQHSAKSSRERLDGQRDRAPRVCLRELLVGRDRTRIIELHRRLPVIIGVGIDAYRMERRQRADVAIRLERYRDLACYLGVCGCSAELRLQPPRGHVRLAKHRTQIAGKGIVRTELVEHRAADPKLGVRLETIAKCSVVLAVRFDEADEPSTDEIIDAYV